MLDVLSAGAHELGVPLSAEQLAQFEVYQRELLDWNTRINLTAIAAPEDVQRKHFLDALACLPAVPPGAWRLIDVGSGAGFPGLAFKIARPALAVTLLEATGKKTAFLEHVVARLGLSAVTVLTARAEEAGQDPARREQYDWAVARAVAALPELVEYLLPFVRVGGGALAPKGPDGPAEAAAAAGALARLGGRLVAVRPLAVPGLTETRTLVVFEKTGPTPPQYPRRPGVPHKKPL